MNITARFLVAALLLIPAAIDAQNSPLVEIGTDVGITYLSGSRASVTYVGAPAQSYRGQPSIYATFFMEGPVFIEPRLALSFIDRDPGSTTAIGMGARIGYLFNGPSANSPFLAADFGFERQSSSYMSISVTDSDVGMGIAGGYRYVIGRGLGLRTEFGFRRWFDSEYNEFRLGIGIGGIVHRG